MVIFHSCVSLSEGNHHEWGYVAKMIFKTPQKMGAQEMRCGSEDVEFRSPTFLQHWNVESLMVCYIYIYVYVSIIIINIINNNNININIYIHVHINYFLALEVHTYRRGLVSPKSSEITHGV